jgi:hypothetical protein
VEPIAGKVSYTFTGQDTATPGEYMTSWEVVLGGGAKMRWPTDGYISIWVEESLTSQGTRQLLSLPEVKNRLQIPANDRVHDAKLVEWIEAIRPLVEDLTGPIIPQVFDEWYRGGHTTISLRHRPHTGLGTTPILNVLAVIEYRGPIPYDLLNVPTPTQGSVYSIMVNKQLGYIARRTSGGGSMPFWHDPEHAGQNIQIRYESGMAEVPAVAKMAAIETIKWWWLATQQVGKGRMTQFQDEPVRPMVALPYHVEAILAPIRKAPSIA